MKKIIILLSVVLAGLFYNFYLKKENVPKSLESKEYQDALDKEKQIKEQILKNLPFKKQGNHFSAHNLKDLNKYQDKTGFLVGPFIVELDTNNKFNFIKLTVKTMKEKLVSPRTLTDLHLKIENKLVPLFSSANGIYYTKIIEDETLLKQDEVEIIIWGRYKENSFSGKIKTNFLKNFKSNKKK